MAARTKSKVTPKYKTKYRVKNWAVYEESLRKRGDITFWFDEGVVRAWNAQPSGRPGGQPRHSDLAIITALTLRTVFHLALRQTEGFVASLIRLMGLDLDTPDHTTCTSDSCDPMVGVIHTPVVCDDGNVCTPDSCDIPLWGAWPGQIRSPTTSA